MGVSQKGTSQPKNRRDGREKEGREVRETCIYITKAASTAPEQAPAQHSTAHPPACGFVVASQLCLVCFPKRPAPRACSKGLTCGDEGRCGHGSWRSGCSDCPGSSPMAPVCGSQCVAALVLTRTSPAGASQPSRLAPQGVVGVRPVSAEYASPLSGFVC
ncbi:hypothetical protein B0T26DRAFT_721251 [Lasiosphaeria miniovina]|uniref:Uncharacterized protein n=1 Tax=Lasiosphaeria miniovina TaxID=1954250 RepID=A0AA40A555_9PEZI|nr:uncharacterized protein B0T26DRAFT_721251 [Lasiosphaeria miniovina]KAK0709348.1 hypothetical protein B0T26DRAFT_721251 [Lasiosphaeria miniovina]